MISIAATHMTVHNVVATIITVMPITTMSHNCCAGPLDEDTRQSLGVKSGAVLLPEFSVGVVGGTSVERE